jgi:hypothetical protein
MFSAYDLQAAARQIWKSGNFNKKTKVVAFQGKCPM